MKAIIVDLDGTLSDPEHRRHLVAGPGKKDWDRFTSEAKNDPPMRHVIDVVQAMAHDGYYVLIVSGRDNRVREDTITWLAKHGVPWDELTMRPDGDYTEDSKLKEQWLKEKILPRYEILFALDDRSRVVEMWRRNGIPCFQVAPGDF